MIMKKTLLSAAAILLATAAYGQRFQKGYVVIPASTELNTYVSQWNGGNGTITIDSKTWEDEEFFTSRVKPRTRIVNRNSQVRVLNDDSDRRLLWWVPVDESYKLSLQNSVFDSESFSMWNYVDHYGVWTSPWGWVPGNIADVAHKNGCAVSGVASIPQSISTEWGNSLTAFIGQNTQAKAEAIGKFLYYHGVDGLGYNSEYSTTSYPGSSISAVHQKINTYMSSRNPIFENIWYDGTGDTGGCSFDSFLSGKTEVFKGASMFSNYNWVSSSGLDNMISRAGSRWKYAYVGINMQGSEPKTGGAYPMLDSKNVSIGYWGAHDHNMLWEGRNGRGSSADAQQASYLARCEQYFSNGVRNPAIQLPTLNTKNHGPSDVWHGVSKYVSARSAINHDLSKEAFYSYFNLGNGKFFNLRGQRVSDNEWYSISFQDYLPTWRFWFAPSFMQKSVAQGAQQLQADFTYDYAYMGGSCLNITGSATTEYLHLFKTDIQVAQNDKFLIRYRLLDGEADLRLVTATVKDPTVETNNSVAKKYQIFTVAETDDVIAQSYDGDGWVTKIFNVASGVATAFSNGQGVGVLALEFKNAKNLNLLIGEMGIYRGTSSGTTEDRIQKASAPEAPIIVKGTTLNNCFYGVDGKLIWKMPNTKAAGEPCYNSDVNVSYFKLWSQEQGGEVKFNGVATSWAGLLYRCPVENPTSGRIRFGVSAVAIDGFNESDISWDSYRSVGTYTPGEDIYLSKLVIKPGEAFSVGYEDPTHSPSTWTIGVTNQDGTFTALKTGTGVTMDVPDGLPSVGGYDLYVDKGTTSERAFGYYIQVSSESIGAIPEVYTVKLDGEDIDEDATVQIALTETPTVSYTGRKADGVASRAMELAARYVGSNMGELLGDNPGGKSFSVCGWFKFRDIPDAEWNFMNVSNKAATWPQNTWGWSWNHGNAKGQVDAVFRGNASDDVAPGELHYQFPDTKFIAGVWYHICCVYEYATEGFRYSLYVNGIKQNSRVFQYASTRGGTGRSFTYNGKRTTLSYTTVNGEKIGDNSGDIYIYGQTYAVAKTDNVYFGGAAHMGKSVDGIVDDFQVWNKAMTQEEVRQAMLGYSGTLPSGLLSLWDFESDPNSDGWFTAKGSNTSARCSNYNFEGDAQNGGLTQAVFAPVFTSGSPFVPGTAQPIVTTATWKDTSPRTIFTKQTTRAATTEDQAGSATVQFRTEGDHQPTLTLTNNHGSYTQNFPIFTVEKELNAISNVDADEQDPFAAYTEEETLYLQFAADGLYNVQVYNTSGMLIASKQLNAAAGQSAQVTLGAPGVYLVKAMLDGRVLRAIKVVR